MSHFDDLDLQERSKTTLPDQAARGAAWTSLFGVLGLGLASWLIIPFGLLGFAIGGVIWILSWPVSVGLAIAALRNQFASRDPKMLRRWAVGALVTDGAVLALIAAFLWSVGK